MESLGYLVIYWLRRLHWQDVVEEDRILQMKETPVETLCLECPPEFEIDLNYTRSLGLDEELDYDYFRDLVRKAFDRHGFVWDHRRGPESPVSQEELVADFLNTYDDLAQNAARTCVLTAVSLAKNHLKGTHGGELWVYISERHIATSVRQPRPTSTRKVRSYARKVVERNSFLP